MNAFRHMRGAMLFAAACLIAAGFVAPAGQVIHTILIVALLGILEVSLSFDNAVVDAKVLGNMTLRWQKRYLTWGLMVSIFGMRLLMPLIFVSVLTGLNPLDAVLLAARDEHRYSEILHGAQDEISAFGGAFLLLVFFSYFFDHEKVAHWLGPVERRITAGATWLRGLTSIYLAPTVLAALTAAVVTGIAWSMRGSSFSFLIAGLAGIMVWIAVSFLSHLMAFDDTGAAVKQGLMGFLYLETLDGSFSFDGVVAAFALSKSIFTIALGLGIGACFVRSITIMLVRSATLTEYRYLEHGAFWAIGSLACLMLASAHYDVPEVVTGLVGASLIGAALLSSIATNRREAVRTGTT